MSYYPPPEGSGYPNSQSGYPNSQSGYPAHGPQQTFNPESGYGQPYGGQPGYPQGPEGYPPAYNAPQPGGFPQGDPYSHGAPGSYPQGPGGFPIDGQNVPKEDLPPGYNPTTGRAFEANELPYGASPAPEGFEGYVPQGMSRDEAQERGFIGAAGGGLLGAWLGRKFGKQHGNHGTLGMLGGGGLGGWLGNKIF